MERPVGVANTTVDIPLGNISSLIDLHSKSWRSEFWAAQGQSHLSPYRRRSGCCALYNSLLLSLCLHRRAASLPSLSSDLIPTQPAWSYTSKNTLIWGVCTRFLCHLRRSFNIGVVGLLLLNCIRVDSYWPWYNGVTFLCFISIGEDVLDRSKHSILFLSGSHPWSTTSLWHGQHLLMPQLWCLN